MFVSCVQRRIVEGSEVGSGAPTSQIRHSCKYESIWDVATRESPQDGCLATKILSGVGVVVNIRQLALPQVNSQTECNCPHGEL